MTALSELGRPAPATPPRRSVDDEGMAALDEVRLAAVRCRSAARLDLFRACRTLSADRDEAGAAVAEAFVRTLGQGLGQAPQFYRPGTRDLTFDERWILSLLSSVRSGDVASVTFLLCSRIAREARRSTEFLARRFASGLDTV